jgi:hypothetical protein
MKVSTYDPLTHSNSYIEVDDYMYLIANKLKEVVEVLEPTKIMGDKPGDRLFFGFIRNNEKYKINIEKIK